MARILGIVPTDKFLTQKKASQSDAFSDILKKGYCTNNFLVAVLPFSVTFTKYAPEFKDEMFIASEETFVFRTCFPSKSNIVTDMFSFRSEVMKSFPSFAGFGYIFRPCTAFIFVESVLTFPDIIKSSILNVPVVLSAFQP